MEKKNSVQSKTSFNIDETTSNGYFSTKKTKHHQCNDVMNAESLSICTEGLGFESFDDVEHSEDEQDINDHHACFDHDTGKHEVSEIMLSESKRSRIKGMEFPPPISSIGFNGKPWVSLKSYRGNGRFMLKEVRIPSQELLNACREDGRLKLQFIQSDDEALYEEEKEEEEEDDDDNNNDNDDDKHLKVDLDGDYACYYKKT